MLRLVIMACGNSRRMGSDKLILPWGESTVLGKVLTEVLAAAGTMSFSNPELMTSAALEIIGVGAQPLDRYVSSGLVKAFLERGGTWWQGEKGWPLAETIHRGLEQLPEGIEGIGFLPGDQIGIDGGQLAGLMGEFLRSRPDFLVPVSGDLNGAPVFFDPKYLSKLWGLQGEEGGKIILRRYPERWTTYSVSSGFLADVDTPEDYQRLRRILGER
ncbi:MAG: nucleotidyltransferase family protein [Desulfitobacteriaceae bacterium]